MSSSVGGGKFGTSVFGRPNDRSPTTIRKASEAGWTSWILKLVGLGSVIITGIGQRFFPSVLRKYLPALPSVLDAQRDMRDESPEAVSHCYSEEKDKIIIGGDQLQNSSKNMISDGRLAYLESMTKKVVADGGRRFKSSTLELKAYGRREMCQVEETQSIDFIGITSAYEGDASQGDVTKRIAFNRTFTEVLDTPPASESVINFVEKLFQDLNGLTVTEGIEMLSKRTVQRYNARLEAELKANRVQNGYGSASDVGPNVVMKPTT